MSKSSEQKQEEKYITLNLFEELNENEKQKDKIQLQFSSKAVEISFINFFRFSQFIQDKCLIDKIMQSVKDKLQYSQATHHIKEENILIFFKLLQGESIPISNCQYCDLCILSEIFQVNTLQQWLQKYIEQHSNDIDFIIDLLLQLDFNENGEIISNNKYSLKMEKCLEENICTCLKNPKFGKLNQSIIYRIVENSDRKKISSDSLFNFISKSIESKYLLFKFLDLRKLSDEKFDELCKLYKKVSNKNFFQYLSNDFLLILQSYKEKQKSNEYQLHSRIRELEEKNEELQAKIDNSNKKSSKNAISNDTEIIKALIENSKNVNNIKIDNKPILTYAYDLKNTNLVKYLVSLNKFYLNSKDDCGKTILHYACESGDKEFVMFLASLNNIDLCSKDNSDNTILHYGCKLGNIEVVKFILSLNKIDINSQNKEGKNALLNAYETINNDLIKYLESLQNININIQDKSGKTILHYACESNDFDIVKYTISLNSFNFGLKDETGKNILHCACKSGNVDLIKYLVSLNKIYIKDEDKNNQTNLHYGCQNGNIDVIKYLISLNKIDINSKDNLGRTILHCACKFGHFNIVKYIISLQKISVKSLDNTGRTILHYACESVKYLVSLNLFDLNAKDNNGKTILFYGCESGNLDVVEYLISLKCLDVNLQDKNKNTILYYSCESNNVKIVKYLISLDAIDVNLKYSDKTLLYIATENNNTGIAKILLNYPGVDVNFIYKEDKSERINENSEDKDEKDHKEWPLLYIAVKNNNTNLVNLLLSNQNIEINCKYIHKNERTIRNNTYYCTYYYRETEEKSAFYLAIEKSNPEIVHLFISNKNIDVNVKYIYDYYEYNTGHCSSNSSKHSYIPSFYRAVEIGNTKIINKMLSHQNIDVNSLCDKYDGRYDYKETSLKKAVSMNKLDIINLLLSYPKTDKKYEIEREQVNMTYQNLLNYLNK